MEQTREIVEESRVVFLPAGISHQTRHEQTVLAASLECGVEIRADCGGQGRCGQCLVMAGPPENLTPWSDHETEHLSQEQLEAGYRLACEAGIRGPVTVTVPTETAAEPDRKNVSRTRFPVDPAVERLSLDPPSKTTVPPEDYKSLTEYMTARVRESLHKEIEFHDPSALNQLSRPFACREAVTLVSHEHRGVTSVLPGRQAGSLGVAVDLGTTTVAVYLCDLVEGTVKVSKASINPQRRFGADVISRINFANEDEANLPLLHELVVGEINRLIAACLEETGADKSDIDEMTLVGNTTMQQIFTGVHPYGLGLSPYLPLSREAREFRAAELKLDLAPGTNVYVFPVFSGFVGGDTLGAVLSEQPHLKDEVSLIVDIGTNGELVLGRKGNLWATSCATGPALEGMHISCGMQASPEAITRIDIDSGTYRVKYGLLKGDPSGRPRGVCGSGIIDAVAAMLRTGLILPTGRIKEGMPGVTVDEQGIGRKFLLVPARDSATDRDIYISLDDIRQIQLAKAALATGIKLMMLRSGLDHIDTLILTGAFGAKFDWRNAVAIGMLPDASVFSNVKIVDNAAGLGAIMALLDRKKRDEAARLIREVTVLELANDAKFHMEYPMAMSFPAAED